MTSVVAPQKLKTVNIIGTSNSITRIGYATKLMFSYKNELRVNLNLSYGASHASLIPYAFELMGENKADYCILDLCVNEHRAASRGLYNFDETWYALDYFLAKCTSFEMLPIVLLIPPIGRNGLIDCSVIDTWEAECIKRSLPYINIFEFLRTLDNDAPHKLYADANHIGDNASDALAKVIIKLCNETLDLKKFDRQLKAVYSYYVAKDFHEEPKFIKNSRYSSIFWPLRYGQKIIVNTEPDSCLVGLSINAAHSNCFLKITAGAECSYKRLDSMLTNPETQMWHVVWQFVVPVRSESGTYELTLAVDCEREYETNDHVSKPILIQCPIEDRRIELGALVFRTNLNEISVFRFKQSPDLLKLLN